MTADDAKRLATLKAQCALVGVELHESDDETGRGYSLCKWAQCAHLETLDEVADWLQRFAGVRV